MGPGPDSGLGPSLGPRPPMGRQHGGLPGTGPPPDVPAAVALELERLRGTVEAGFTRVDGALALLVQRNDQTDKQLDDHEARLDALERSRWPLASITALAAVSGVALTAWQLAGR